MHYKNTAAAAYMAVTHKVYFTSPQGDDLVCHQNNFYFANGALYVGKIKVHPECESMYRPLIGDGVVVASAVDPVFTVQPNGGYFRADTTIAYAEKLFAKGQINVIWRDGAAWLPPERE